MDDYDDHGECANCGGEGFTYGCSWDWQCDTYDEGEGTCLCERRCGWCNPPVLSAAEKEEVVKVAVNDLIGSWDARRDLWPIEDAVRAGVVAAEQAQAATIASLRAELAEARSKGMMEEAGLIEDADPEYAEFIRQKAAETAAGADHDR